MPAVTRVAGGEDGGILDITDVKSVGEVTFSCPLCSHTWSVVFKRSTLNTMFGGFTWSLDDCTDKDGNPGSKIFRAYGELECPSCSGFFFFGVEAHENGALCIYGSGGKPEEGWWETQAGI